MQAYIYNNNGKIGFVKTNALPLAGWIPVDETVEPRLDYLDVDWQTGEITENVAKKSAIDIAEIERARIEKKMQIQAAYEKRIAADYPYNGKIYQCDGAAQLRISHGLNLVNAGLTSIDWTAKDNSRSTFTDAQFKEMATGMFARGQGFFVVMRAKKDELAQLSTLSEIEAYNVEAGW